MKYYEIYHKESNVLLAKGTARECRKIMGCSTIDTFYSLVSHVRTGRNNLYRVVTKESWETDYPVLGKKDPVLDLTEQEK